MTRASTPTLLSLDDFAKHLGINPVHFAGAVATDTTPLQVMPLNNSCNDLWPQYDWQHNGRVSREQIAYEIQRAESDIAQIVRYPLAPTWIAQEESNYTRPFERTLYGRGWDVRNRRKTIQTRWGKLISGGRRAVSAIETGATVVYSDDDSDGFSETATITVTSSVDTSEIKVFFAGNSGSPIWEVRPVDSITQSGGTTTIVLKSWLLIDPDLWETLPTTDGFQGINISTTTNFVTTVDVYRVYNDTTQAHAEFSWREPCQVCGGGSGCEACNQTTQDGCSVVSDDKTLAVFPASYDADNSQWTSQLWSETREPDRLQLWYYAGNRSNDYLSGFTLIPYDQRLARAVAYLVVARVQHELCECSNVVHLVNWLREDVTRLSEGPTFFTHPSLAVNPFGTRRGEVIAWNTVARMVDKSAEVAVI